jgi:hypothetical protein
MPQIRAGYHTLHGIESNHEIEVNQKPDVCPICHYSIEPPGIVGSMKDHKHGTTI